MLKRILSSFTTHTTVPRTKLAIVVRSDIKMSRGKTAAQTAHAAVLCFSEANNNQEKKCLLEAWYTSGQPKIVLRVDSYDSIINLEKMAKKNKVTAALVRDAGKTQLAPGTATVLGIGPDTVEEIDKLVSHLKLL